MLKRDSRLWLLSIPIAILGSAFLAAQLRAPHDAGPLKLDAKINLSFDGLRNVSGPSGDARIPGEDYVLVTFGYTSCPDVCPTTLIAVHEILEQLGPEARRVRPIFISVDPERDTPARLELYVSAFDPRIVAMTGSSAAIDRAAKTFHIRYVKRAAGGGSGDYQIDHTAMLYMLNPVGRVIAAVPETGSPRSIAAAMLLGVRTELAGTRIEH